MGAFPPSGDVTWTDLAWSTYLLPATVHAAADGAAQGDGAFVGLAPRNGGGSTVSYDIVSWAKQPARADAQPTVLAWLNNSHPPTVPLLHEPLGYVGASRVGAAYATLTVALHPSKFLPGVGDKWALQTLDLAADDVAGSLRELPLEPQPSFEGAEVVSLSGFGLAA